MNMLQYKIMKPYLSWENKAYKRWAAREGRRIQLYDETVREISEYTGESIDTVRQKHHLGPRSEPAFAIFQEQDKLTVNNVEQFYKEATYYLYELPLWNAERARPLYLYRVVRPYLEKYGCSDVLDFGGGTGDLCLQLADRGIQMNYCDIGKEVAEFARWRFERRKLHVPMVDSLDGLSGRSFDAIISFDCFEHIKGLDTVVQRLVQLIRDGGLLISGDAFEGGGLHLEENYKYHDPDTFDALLQRNGLQFVGRLAQFVFYQKIKR